LITGIVNNGRKEENLIYAECIEDWRNIYLLRRFAVIPSIHLWRENMPIVPPF
jgi:hypothetical protein